MEPTPRLDAYELTPKRKGRFGTWVRRLAIFAMVALTLLTAAHATWAWRQASKFDAAIAGYRAAGEPVTAEDFVSKPVPDDQNGAVILGKAARSIDEESQPWVSYHAIVDDVAHPMTPAEVAAHRAVVEAHADALTAPAKAALLPSLEWNLNWKTPVLGTMDLKFLKEQRSLANLLAADARLAVHDGDHGRSLRRVREMLMLSDAIDRQPSLICHLVSLGVASLAYRSAIESSHLLDVAAAVVPDGTVGSGPAPRGEVMALIAHLMDTDRLKTARKRMWLGERMIMIDTMQAVASGDMPIERMTSGAGEKPSAGERVWSYLMKPIALNDGHWLANELTLASRSADAESIVEYLERQPGHAGKFDVQRWQLFARVLMPSPLRAMEQDYLAMAQRRMAAVALACRLFSLDHDGKLPATLNDLVPKYLPSVPLDPMTKEKPLVYQRDAAIIYSIGRDLNDDNGREPPAKPVRAKDRENTDDVAHL